MYFSHNVSYFLRPKDPNDPSKGKSFFTLEELSRIEEDTKRIKRTKNDSLINQFLEEEFTEEEIAFLKANWTPAK